MTANDKKKAETLLSILGVGDKLAEIDHKEAELANERTVVGRELKSKSGHAEQMPFYPDLPLTPISASELIKHQSSVLLKNAENEKLRQQTKSLEDQGLNIAAVITHKKDQLDSLAKEISDLEKDRDEIRTKYSESKKSADQVQDEGTEEVEKQLNQIESTNTHIRCNLEKQSATEEAKEKKKEYDSLTENIEKVRQERLDLLNGARLPLPELGISDGKLTYKNQNWDCMSGAEQLIVSTAIIRQLKPECGFVLTDKLEQMDSNTIATFNDWLIEQGLQNIGTTVGDREECTIIIEDGLVAENRTITKTKTKPKWEFS
jgi:hypothetical protein